MANEDPFRPRSPDIFSVGRSAPRAAEKEPPAEEEEEERAAADPWQPRREEQEEEAEEEERGGGDPWARPTQESGFFSARTTSSKPSSDGSAWTQVRRESAPDEGKTSQSFAVRRYDPRAPKEKENPFASKEQPAPPPRRESSFGSSSSAPPPPPRKREPDPPVPDNPFTSKPRDNPFASRKGR